MVYNMRYLTIEERLYWAEVQMIGAFAHVLMENKEIPKSAHAAIYDIQTAFMEKARIRLEEANGYKLETIMKNGANL